MDCPQCVAENEQMLKEKGYCRSYVPNYAECTTHNKNQFKTPRPYKNK